MAKDKQVTVESFFRKPFALVAWKKGYQLFIESVTQSIPVSDGVYPAVLTDINFMSPSTGRGIVQFFFSLENPVKEGELLSVIKSMAIESSEGTALFMWEMAKLGLKIVDPMDTEQAFKEIRKARFMVEIAISSMGGLRRVIISGVKMPSQMTDPRPVAPPIVEIRTEVHKAEGAEPIKNGHAPQEPKNEEDGEINIEPGHKIVAKIEGQRVQATVLLTFEDIGKLAVVTSDNKQTIISASDVVKFLG